MERIVSERHRGQRLHWVSPRLVREVRYPAEDPAEAHAGQNMEQNEELDPLTLTSDEDDEEEEYFDTFGQRIRPSRADTAPQPVSSEILTSEPSSHSRAETAPLPVSSASPSPIIHLRPSSSSSSSSPSPIIHLRPSSSSSSSGSSHSRSRGKGGRKLVVSGNKFQKKN